MKVQPVGQDNGNPQICKFLYYLVIAPLHFRGATAPKTQDRLKWLLPDGSTGDLVVSKALIPQP